MLVNRIGGTISIVFGGIAVEEAIRLYPLRIGTYGDHTLPGIVGGLMVLLGLILIFFIKEKRFEVEFPKPELRVPMILSMGFLFAYWVSLHFLGYVISSFLLSVGLFKVLGSYNWYKSVGYSIILTAVLYLMFIYWLMMPFPASIFEI